MSYALMAGAFALAFGVVALAKPARSHSFYPWECCSSQDCWPMGADSDAREPDPKEVAGGFVTHDGIFVPEAETRVSPDGRFHICRRGGKTDGDVIAPSFRPICMWRPGRGS